MSDTCGCLIDMYITRTNVVIFNHFEFLNYYKCLCISVSVRVVSGFVTCVCFIAYGVIVL